MCRRREFYDRRYPFGHGHDPCRRDPVAEKNELLDTEFALLGVHLEAVLLEKVKNLEEVYKVFLLDSTGDQLVVQVQESEWDIPEDGIQ